MLPARPLPLMSIGHSPQQVDHQEPEPQPGPHDGTRQGEEPETLTGFLEQGLVHLLPQSSCPVRHAMYVLVASPGLAIPDLQVVVHAHRNGLSPDPRLRPEALWDQ